MCADAFCYIKQHDIMQHEMRRINIERLSMFNLFQKHLNKVSRQTCASFQSFCQDKLVSFLRPSRRTFKHKRTKMDAIGKFVVACAIIHLVYYSGKPNLLVAADETPATRPPPSIFSPVLKLRNDLVSLLFGKKFESGRSEQANATKLGFIDDLAAAELLVQGKLLQMLHATNELMSTVQFSPQLKACSAFNKTLHEAETQLVRLQDASKLWRNMLHEQADASRKQTSQSALGALGATVASYFDCIAQLSQLGLVNKLAELLPISLDMGKMSSIVEQLLMGKRGGGGGTSESVTEAATEAAAPAATEASAASEPSPTTTLAMQNELSKLDDGSGGDQSTAETISIETNEGATSA